MKELLLNLPKTNKPKYRRLADAIRATIRAGILKPGDILPSTRTLAKKHGYNRHTVMTALSELTAEGWIVAKEKINYQVVDTLPSAFLQPKEVVENKFTLKKTDYKFARNLVLDIKSQKQKFRFSYPSGFPDPRLFPMKEFKTFLYDSMKSKNVLIYGDPRGEPKLIEEISHYLRKVRHVSDRSILVTNGSQEAIFYLAQIFIRPGDYVAVESLGYPPAIEALRFAGAKIIPIEVDKEGLVVDDLEKKLKRYKIRMLYTTPLHQYPTTVTLSATRRLQLYELAYKNNLLILEDDYDHEFHYTSQPIAPLASFDPAGIVLYVSTFSKIMFPTARVGFVAVPEKIAAELSKLKRISSRQNETLLQESIARWMQSGGFERHLRKMRRIYFERLNSMVEALLELKKDHPQISWETPSGGMALWLNIHRDSQKFAATAKHNGILVYPETNYRFNDTKKPGTHLRLGFSGQTPTENKQGLIELFSLF